MSIIDRFDYIVMYLKKGTAEKMKFSITDFLSKCGQIRRKNLNWRLEYAVFRDINFFSSTTRDKIFGKKKKKKKKKSSKVRQDP